MKRRIRPALLESRPQHDREEFMGLHFAAGPERDAARVLWGELETTFGVDLQGLHPDDELGELLRRNPRPDSRRVGTFRECAVALAARDGDLSKVEFVLGLEEAITEWTRW